MRDEQPDETTLDEIEIEAIGIEIDSQPIELYKVLKIANLVSGGGEAKHIISEGYVAVNGELETRKRRKIYDGDLIEFNREFYLVLCERPEDELPEVFEEDLLDEAYQVSEQERAEIESRFDFEASSDLDDFAFENEFEEIEIEPTDEDDNSKESSTDTSAWVKKSGRKSIDFF